MKNLYTIIMFFLLICGFSANADSADYTNNGSMLLCVVIDKSPSSHWNQIGILSGQAIGLPDVGDRLLLITAETGRPSILADCSIESQTVPGRENLNRLLADIRQTFLIRPDVARAVSAAFDGLDRYSKTYKCALLVVTDGQMDDGQIRQIRRLATAFKARGWPLCITASRDANRQLFLAGSQNELQVVMLDRADLTKWFASVRPKENAKTSETWSTVANRSTSIDPNHVESASKKADMDTQKALDNIPLKDLNAVKPQAEPNEIKPPVKRISPLPAPTGTRKPEEQAQSEPLPPDKPVDPNSTGKKPQAGSHRLSTSLLIWSIAAALGLIAGLYVLKDSLSMNKFRSLSEKQAAGQEDMPSHLIAFVGEQRLDLGDFKNLADVTVGRGVGSTIFIDDKAVEEKHVRIFKAGKRLKIQNLASEPVLVNGIVLSQNKKTVLDLPADIQMAPEVTISLILESIEPVEGGQNNEN